MSDYENFKKKFVIDKEKASVISQLKKESIPLVLWGAGDVAMAVKEYLEINQIKIAAVWVDGEHESSYFEQIPIYSLSKIKLIYPNFNVILGHSNYQLADGVFERESQINNMFYFVSIFYNQYENISQKFLIDHLKDYYLTYNDLVDEESKKAMIAYLNARVNNDIDFIKQCFRYEQTFYKNDIYTITDKEKYIDVGAYNGDTLQIFLEQCQGKYSSIYAFEPEEDNFKGLQEYVTCIGIDDCKLYKLGTWFEKSSLNFSGNQDKRSSLSDAGGRGEICVDSLDNIIGDNEQITFIKINFLHGVYETLKGSKKIICKNKPKLAIVVGFDEYALIRIPQYLKKLNPDYKCYLRFNRCMPACLTLYVE